MTYATLHPDLECGYTNGVNVCIGDETTLISVGQGRTLCEEEDRFKEPRQRLEEDAATPRRRDLTIHRKYITWTLENEEDHHSGHLRVGFPSQFGPMVIQPSTTCPLVNGISRFFSISSGMGKCDINIKGTGGNRRNPDGKVDFWNYGSDPGAAVIIKTQPASPIQSIQLWQGAIGQVATEFAFISFQHNVQSYANVNLWS